MKFDKFDGMGQITRTENNKHVNEKNKFINMVRDFCNPCQSLFPPLERREDHIPKGFYFFNEAAQRNMKGNMDKIEAYIIDHKITTFDTKTTEGIVDLKDLLDTILKSFVYSNLFLEHYKPEKLSKFEEENARKNVIDRLLKTHSPPAKAVGLKNFDGGKVE